MGLLLAGATDSPVQLVKFSIATELFAIISHLLQTQINDVFNVPTVAVVL